MVDVSTPEDATLGGYLRVHERPPAFEGPDGAAYSVAMFADDAPVASGLFGAALLFIRWSRSGEQPEGHVETEFLMFARSPTDAVDQLKALTLWEIKRHLDLAVAAKGGETAW